MLFPVSRTWLLSSLVLVVVSAVSSGVKNSAVNRDYYGYNGGKTKRPTSRNGVRSDYSYGYQGTSRPTSRNGQAVKSDYYSYVRPTNRPTSGYSAKAKSDYGYYKGYGTKRPTSQLNRAMGAKPNFPQSETTSKKYFHVQYRRGWNAAQDFCARKGAQLAIIHSMDEHRQVSEACQGECWIGADRGNVGDSFGWNDETAMDFVNWGDNEPRHEQESGLCAKMDGSADQKWTSADCDEQLGFVCQNMHWDVFRLQAAVDEPSDVFSFASSFARGNILSLALMIVAVVVVGFLAGNYVCLVANHSKRELVEAGNLESVDVSSEKTPLISTKTW